MVFGERIKKRINETEKKASNKPKGIQIANLYKEVDVIQCRKEKISINYTWITRNSHANPFSFKESRHCSERHGTMDTKPENSLKIRGGSLSNSEFENYVLDKTQNKQFAKGK